MMFFYLFGDKISILNVFFIFAIGLFIGVNVLCSCSCGLLEGFRGDQTLTTTDLNYSMGDGVPVSWTNTKNTKADVYSGLKNNVGGPVPLPEGELLMFSENKFDPSCCPSIYSNSSGCACISEDQMKYLNERGGNRTLSSIY